MKILKSKPLFYFLSTVSTVLVCGKMLLMSGCSTNSGTGWLTLVDKSKPLQFKSITGRIVEIDEGAVDLQYHAKGLNVTESTFVIKSISTEDGVAFNIPTSCFQTVGGPEFIASASQIDQPMTIKASREVELLSSNEYKRKDSCTGCGVCAMSKTTTDSKGNTTTTTTFGYNCNCSGEVDALHLREIFIDHFNVKFFEPNGTTLRGTYKGESPAYEKDHHIRDLGDCEV